MRTNDQEAELNLLIDLSGYVDSKISPNTWHSLGVARLAMEIARNLQLTDEQIEQVCMAALFHDVGKIGIPDEVLSKPGPLNPDEWALMKLHPVIGASIFKSMDGSAASDSESIIAPAIHYHQERYDGSGYPDGLSGEDIPWGARILAVVDAFDAMVNDRVYRKALTQGEAVAEIVSNAGRDFDPGIIEAFLKCIDDSCS